MSLPDRSARSVAATEAWFCWCLVCGRAPREGERYGRAIRDRGCWCSTLNRFVDSPVNLAVTRIAVGLVVLFLPELHAAPLLAGSLLNAAVLGVPVTGSAAWAVYGAVVLGATAGVLGIRPRLGFAVVTVGGVYLLGIPQLVGSTVHYHHLLWFSALLAVSPCGHAVTVFRPSPPPRSAAYGVPLRLAWLLVGLVFFFPGLAKLLAQGPFWDPTPTLYWKWAQSWAFTPAVQIDEWPGLLRAGGLAVVVFELGFVFAVFHRRTRMWAVAAALVFHAATSWLFNIKFSSLYLTYFMFVDWAGLLGVEHDGVPLEAKRARLETLVVGAGLVVGAAIPGVLGQTQGWPFACYPTFAQRPPPHMPGLQIAWVDEAGQRHRVPMSQWADARDAQPMWGRVWRISGVTGPVDREALEALYREVAQRNGLSGEVGVEFHRANRMVNPSARPQWVVGPLLHSTGR